MKVFQITLILCSMLALQTLGAPVSETTAPPLPSEATPVGSSSTATLSFTELAEEVKKNSLSSGSAAYLTYQYTLKNLLHHEVPSPAEPCFLEERDGDELDGHSHPDIDYVEKLVEDRESLRGYYGYLVRVEREYNATLVKIPMCGFCVRFNDLMTSTEKLVTSLEQLILSANSSLPTDQPTTVDERCYGLCFEQQARTYLRYQALASLYIVNDINGLLQQKSTDKKTN